MFKIGDRVTRISGSNGGMNVGDTGTIISLTVTGTGGDILLDKNGKISVGNSLSMLKLLEDSQTNTMSNLKSKIKNLFRSEPEKSFIKAGIMDETMELTADGKDVFLGWLFGQNKDDFNTEVVQKLLADQDKECKK